MKEWQPRHQELTRQTQATEAAASQSIQSTQANDKDKRRASLMRLASQWMIIAGTGASELLHAGKPHPWSIKIQQPRITTTLSMCTKSPSCSLSYRSLPYVDIFSCDKQVSSVVTMLTMINWSRASKVLRSTTLATSSNERKVGRDIWTHYGSQRGPPQKLHFLR